jgi:CBS domain-containing protein
MQGMDLKLPVSTIMTSPVECVMPNQKIIDLKHIYESQHFHHHIPVTENGQLVGMVSLIDFMRAISYASLDDNEAIYSSKTVNDIMSIHPVGIDESSTIGDVANLLAKGEFNSVVITNDNHVIGIVTTTDLIRYFLK